MSHSDIFLQELGIFSGLSSSEQALIKPYLVEKTFSKDTVIVKQGGTGHDLYIIVSGIANVWVRLPGDYEKQAIQLEKGQIFGEVAFLAERPFTASAVADSELKCLVFYRHILDMLRVAYPEVAYKIERVIARQAKKKITDHLERIRELIQTVAINKPVVPGHGRYLPKLDAESKPVEIDTLNPLVLKKIPVFSLLSDDEFAILKPLLHVMQYDKGFNFTNTSLVPSSINIIYSGAIMLFLRNEKHLIKSLDVLGVGKLFLNNSSDPDFAPIAAYVSCENCILLQISLKNYMKLHRLYPRLFYKISQYLHSSIVGSIFILNREFVRINCEYSELTS